MKKLTLPLTSKEVKELHAGNSVLLSGIILTARDCAHRRIKEIMERGEKLPFEIEGAYIYYAGPCPAKPGMTSGSCGPTTSARMDSFAPALLDAGLGGMIGKGEMSKEVREAVYRLEVENFPAVVAFDCYGQSIYD